MMRAAPAAAPRSRTEPDDAALMRAVAAGDLGALGSLYDRHHDTVLQFLGRVAPADAEDLGQESFLTAVHAAASYDGRPRAAPFLIGIAAQLVRRRRRFLARWSELLWEIEELWAGVVPTPEESVQIIEDLERIDRALARMSQAKRLVYVMIEREGMSSEDVAAALGIPLGTVWTRLHHARAALDRALTRGRKP
jgi:RNA polymerase sigma-70 factor (ECF subfamily)